MTKTKVVKLSSSEEIILGMLLGRDRELYGLQIVHESEGAIARGSVYVTLDRMADKGLVESRQEDREPGQSGIARRLYRATGHGARVYKAWVQRRQFIVGAMSPAI